MSAPLFGGRQWLNLSPPVETNWARSCCIERRPRMCRSSKLGEAFNLRLAGSRLAAMFLLECLFGAGNARAESASPRFRVSYSAPAACPQKEDFIAAVLARVPFAREAGDLAPTLSFRVSLEGDDTATVGRLVVEQEGVQASRETPAAPCREVADSMAVMIALLLENEVKDGHGSQTVSATSTSDTASGAAVEGSAPPTVAVEPPTRAAQPPTDRGVGRAAPGHAALVSVPEARTRLRAGVNLSADMETGAVDGPLPAIAASGEVWLARSGWLSPSARLGLVYGQKSVSTAVGAAEFRLLTARLNLCPARYPNGWLSVRACAVVDVGELRGDGSAIVRGRVERMLWLGIGGGLRIEAVLDDFVALEAGFDSRILVHRDRFAVQPGDQLVHQVPRAALGTFLGATARFP